MIYDKIVQRYDNYHNRYYEFEIVFDSKCITHIEQCVSHGYHCSQLEKRYKVFLNDDSEPFIVGETLFQLLIKDMMQR